MSIVFVSSPTSYILTNVEEGAPFVWAGGGALHQTGCNITLDRQVGLPSVVTLREINMEPEEGPYLDDQLT